MRILLFAVLVGFPTLPGLLPRLSAQGTEEAAAGSSVMFDGAGHYAPLGGSTGVSEQEKAALLAELKTKVTIDDRGVPAEGAALDAMLARLMDSPTGRELAGKFIKEDARAVISFEMIPNTRILDIDGRKEFWTSGGHTATRKVPPEVRLNQAYLEAQEEDAPGTLAHELFGHALERKRAERFGVAASYLYNQNEEANAGLIGWTVRAELGNRIDAGWAWIYMDNPENYHQQLKTNLPYYAGTLSTEEMADPLSAYQTRLAAVNKLLENIPVRVKRNEDWMNIIYHLVDSHNMDGSSFQTLKDDINGSLASLPGREKGLRNIKTYLLSLIKAISTKDGDNVLTDLPNASKNPYFVEMREIMEARRQVLAGLMLGKTEKSEQRVGRPGQFTWDRLEEFWARDKAGSCGWAP